MGNLMPRYEDGVFQENILENAFVNKLAAFIRIGAIPEYMLNESLEITPIDMAANEVYKLITHPTNSNRIFHIYNHHYITVSKYIKILNKMNYKVEIVPNEEFKNKINTMLQNDEINNQLNNIINDFDKNLQLKQKNDLIIKSKFTIKYLRKLNFKWRRISRKYLIKFINLIEEVM